MKEYRSILPKKCSYGTICLLRVDGHTVVFEHISLKDFSWKGVSFASKSDILLT